MKATLIAIAAAVSLVGVPLVVADEVGFQVDLNDDQDCRDEHESLTVETGRELPPEFQPRCIKMAP